MANIALSTIGVKVSYVVEEVSGTRPEAGYIHIPGIRSTPDFNQSPSTGDGTTFENQVYTTKVPLLRELPDALEFGAVFGQEFADKWDALVSAYETARDAGKSVWFCIDIPDYDQALFFTGEPITMGLPAMEVNSVIECPVYIVPTGEPVKGTNPTYAEA